jgi:hypothetical protein
MLDEDADRINDVEGHLDKQLLKLAEQYASCDRRSAEINEERKTIRDNAEKIGVPSKSFVHAVAMTKQMSEGERRDYQVGVNRVLKAISERQNDLFPVEAEKIRKREQAAADAQTTPGPDADTNPRSDPNSGGAKPQTESSVENSGEKPWPDDPQTAAIQQAQAEQAEGESVIEEMQPETKKASQSAKAKEKLAAAGMH